MTRTIQDTCDQQPVRTAEVQDVAVVAPHGQHFTFVRGRLHTPYDVATFIIRAARLNVTTDEVFVTDCAGSQLWPSPADNRDGALQVTERFRNATCYRTYPRKTVWS